MHAEYIELNEDYIVYRDGRIWSKRSQIFLKPAISGAGYLMHSRSVTKGMLSPSLHRILAHCFLGGVERGLVVNHKDGNKLNNCLDNLELVSYSQNSRHARDTGLIRKVPSEANPMAKLSIADVEQIHEMFHKGLCNDTIGDAFDIHPRYVSLLRHGKRWPELYVKNGPFPGSQKPSPYEEKYIRFLEIGEGKSNAELGRILHIDASTISRWRTMGARKRGSATTIETTPEGDKGVE